MYDTDLRYLEGSNVLKDRMHALSGRVPNATQIAFASSCLLHGRMFWEAAERAAMETSPLQLYYGAAAYAKALVVASTGVRAQDLHQAHGLKCGDPRGDKIADFRIWADGQGLFQEFNDVAAGLNRMAYSDEHGDHAHYIQTAASRDLGQFNVSLKDCLARCPGIEKTYRLCTGEDQQLTYMFPFPFVVGNAGESFRIQVDLPTPTPDLATLNLRLATLRARVPFLEQWRLQEASNGYGRTMLTFINIRTPHDEGRRLFQAGAHFSLDGAPEPGLRFDPMPTLAPLTGGWSNAAALIGVADPIAGQHVNEHSVMLAALLGLSSLVRYRPHTWTACVHRRPIGQNPVDDTMLPVIEAFLATVKSSFPQFIAGALMRA